MKSPATAPLLTTAQAAHIVAVSDTGAHCIGYDRNGNPVSTTSYLKSALRERPVVCRVDLSALELQPCK